MKKAIIAVLIFGSLIHIAAAGPNWLWGNISDHTSVAGGMMIMLDTGVPDNCTGVAYGWMLIPEANKTMIAVTLLAIAQGRAVAVYTNPLSNGSCVINQLDPNG